MIDADRNMPRSDGRGRETLGQRAVCLCLRAWHWMQMSKPPSCADVHADPPIKSLKHGKRASDSKVAEALVWHACMIHGRMRSGSKFASARREAGELHSCWECQDRLQGRGSISAPTEGSRRHPYGGVFCRLKSRFPTEGAVCGTEYERRNRRGELKGSRGGGTE